MNNFLLNQKSPTEISKIIADNVKKRRKELKLSQIELAKKSGVSWGSIKRFENTAQISLQSLIKIAVALDSTEDFLKLFSQKKYSSIDEIIKGTK